METIHRNLKELVNDCIPIMFLFGTIGIALKFTTFFNQWVYFPSFPNICDSIFLISSEIYFMWKIFGKRFLVKNKTEKTTIINNELTLKQIKTKT